MLVSMCTTRRASRLGDLRTSVSCVRRYKLVDSSANDEGVIVCCMTLAPGPGGRRERQRCRPDAVAIGMPAYGARWTTSAARDYDSANDIN